jgi:sugar phosphate isomerase/epimerase
MAWTPSTTWSNHPAIGINYDTGNSYLAGGSDPYEWLERVRDRLVHLHAKDISMQQGEAERGKVTGTPVGCACGEGVVDWQRVIDIVKPVAQDARSFSASNVAPCRKPFAVSSICL